VMLLELPSATPEAAEGAPYVRAFLTAAGDLDHAPCRIASGRSDSFLMFWLKNVSLVALACQSAAQVILACSGQHEGWGVTT
jgi:hypothetical protein